MIKRHLLIFALCILAIPLAFASVEIQHDVTAEESEPITVSVLVNPENTKMFDISEMIPTNWEIDSWEVENYDKSNIDFESITGRFLGETYNINHWKFDGRANGDVEITYTVSPKSVGEYETLTLWFTPDGFGKEDNMINILPVNKKSSSSSSDKNSPITGLVLNSVSEDNSQENIQKASLIITDTINAINSISIY